MSYAAQERLSTGGRFKVRAGVLAAVLALASAPAVAAPVAYVCDGNVSFSADFDAGGDRLLLELPGGFRVELTPDVSGSGFRYTGGGYELHGKGAEALLTRPGEQPLQCREDVQGRTDDPRGPAGPTGPGGPPPAFASPSFDCSGDLNPTESRICANPTLAELDRRMAAAYKELLGKLDGAERDPVRQYQRQWLVQRDGCGYDDACIEAQYRDLIASLIRYEPPPDPPATPDGRVEFPHPAESWGGIVRDGPGLHHRRLAGLKEGEPITLLEDTGVLFNGYPWFKIKFRGRTGYQWGGIICPRERTVPGTFQVCN